MILDLDLESPVPPYEQVRVQLAAMITAGTLRGGHRLPSIRQLASDLGIAPGTVGRAYRELEAAGLVASRVRTGTVVARVPDPAPAHLPAAAEDAARGYAVAARRLGLDLDAAIARLRAQWRELPGD